MRFTLTIECDNAAFADDQPAELARILYDTADRVDQGALFTRGAQTVRDSNGNTVGSFTLTGEATP